MMDSMWDVAPDYCHYTKWEARMEAFYIVQKIFRMADEKKNNTNIVATCTECDGNTAVEGTTRVYIYVKVHKNLVIV
jgi:hypothetical protein